MISNRAKLVGMVLGIYAIVGLILWWVDPFEGAMRSVVSFVVGLAFGRHLYLAWRST